MTTGTALFIILYLLGSYITVSASRALGSDNKELFAAFLLWPALTVMLIIADIKEWIHD